MKMGIINVSEWRIIIRMNNNNSEHHRNATTSGIEQQR